MGPAPTAAGQCGTLLLVIPAFKATGEYELIIYWGLSNQMQTTTHVRCTVTGMYGIVGYKVGHVNNMLAIKTQFQKSIESPIATIAAKRKHMHVELEDMRWGLS